MRLFFDFFARRRIKIRQGQKIGKEPIFTDFNF